MSSDKKKAEESHLQWSTTKMFWSYLLAPMRRRMQIVMLVVFFFCFFSLCFFASWVFCIILNTFLPGAIVNTDNGDFDS
jgi:hypothetical protein